MKTDGIKILAVCDSPTVNTGFARVAQNLLQRWHRDFGAQIDVWGINFSGYPHGLPYRIYPATVGTDYSRFRDPDRLSALLQRIQAGKYNAVWFISDLLWFARHKFPEMLHLACTQSGARSFFYFPMDSMPDDSWLEILRFVDCPVAYTEQGRAALDAPLQERTRILPHGTDPAVYFTGANRLALRKELFSADWIQPDDLFLLNVNQNQKRKDVARSLQLLAELKQLGVPAKLLMHMSESSNDGVSLLAVAQQLGLRLGVDWVHSGESFKLNHPTKDESFLNKLYNAADLLVSTSLGEGWGLSITEAMAAGCPVAIPHHSACLEIGRKLGELGSPDRITMLPVDHNISVLPSDNSRVRRAVNVREAAMLIQENYEGGAYAKELRRGLTAEALAWLSWDRIAGEWMRLFRSGDLRGGDEVRSAEVGVRNVQSGTNGTKGAEG